MLWSLLALIALSILTSAILFLLQRRRRSRPDYGERPAQFLVDAAAILGGFATLFALAVGAITYVRSERLQRDLAASSVWREYLSSAVANPRLAEGKYDSTNFAQYEWFVGHAFHAAEAIVQTQSQDSFWIAAVCETIRKHEKYLRSKDFPMEHYGGLMRELLESVRAGRKCAL